MSRIAQIAPIDRHARYRRSSDAAWPIRLADGRTPAQAKADAIKKIGLGGEP
jgi:hypothetical protein